MFKSPPTLHPDVIATDKHRDLARGRIEALVSRRPESGGKRVDDGTPVATRLTTVSAGGLDLQLHFSLATYTPVQSGGTFSISSPIRSRIMA